MANNDQLESYEKILSVSHSRMIDFVKFAEAKNAALLTFCSVWIGTIVTLLRSETQLPMGYDAAFLIVLPVMVVAAVMSLTSFLPRLLHHYHRPEDNSANMLYFGDIAKIGAKDFKSSIKERYLPSENETFSDAYLDDLAVQTAVQASIAARKFRTFNAAGRLVLASFVCMAMPPIIWIIQVVWRLLNNGLVAG